MTSDWAEFPSDDPTQLEIWGYTDKLSYEPGETVQLHVSTTAEVFSVEIVRDGAEPLSLYHQDALKGRLSPTRTDAYTTGCDWPSLHSIQIPGDWDSGGYVVIFRVTRDDVTVQSEGFFCLRPSAQSVKNKSIALVLATSTWIAYNNWAGGCSYTNPDLVDHTDLDKTRTEGFIPVLSTQRPWARGLIRLPDGHPRVPLPQAPGKDWAVHYPAQEWPMANGYAVTCTAAGWAAYDSLMARWLESEGYDVGYLTQHDLHFQADILDDYDCVISCGHDEYWSHPARQTLDSYIEKGGHYVRLGGNIFWQVRLENDGTTQTCYKYIADEADPVRDPDLFTAAFEARSLNRPGVTTFGANGGQGVYTGFGGTMPRSSGGFTVYRNQHWAFENTDLYYGDILGGSVPLVGYEVDGVDYTFRHGLPYPTGDDGTPDALEILALSPATMEEEDHGHDGQVLQHGDGDLMILSKALHGDTSEESLSKTRYGSAVITSMPKGQGEVFCAGTTEWPYALNQSEPFVEQITRNVLARFTGSE